MRVLVACEFSGVVREAFRRRGHDAWSCDFLPPLDNSKYHFQCNVLKPMNDMEWDLMIAHPPCTHLAVSGAPSFKNKDPQLQVDALNFFRLLLEAQIPRICVENPMSIASTRIRPKDQAIQPYQFGEDASKTTWLWLKNLSHLVPTQYIPPRIIEYQGKMVKRWGNQTPQGSNKFGPSPDRWIKRSITFQGIANAMAEQWG